MKNHDFFKIDLSNFFRIITNILSVKRAANLVFYFVMLKAESRVITGNRKGIPKWTP